MTPSLSSTSLMFLELRPRGVLSAAQSADVSLPMTHVATMLCPSRHREIRCNDFWFRGSAFRVICGGCDLMLLSVEE